MNFQRVRGISVNLWKYLIFQWSAMINNTDCLKQDCSISLGEKCILGQRPNKQMASVSLIVALNAYAIYNSNISSSWFIVSSMSAIFYRELERMDCPLLMQLADIAEPSKQGAHSIVALFCIVLVSSIVFLWEASWYSGPWQDRTSNVWLLMQWTSDERLPLMRSYCHQTAQPNNDRTADCAFRKHRYSCTDNKVRILADDFHKLIDNALSVDVISSAERSEYASFRKSALEVFHVNIWQWVSPGLDSSAK